MLSPWTAQHLFEELIMLNLDVKINLKLNNLYKTPLLDPNMETILQIS